jgi:hypothetical protein
VLSLQEKSEKDLVVLLRVVFDKAEWKRIARAHSKYDIYAHKVKAAGNQGSISTFLEKLCHSLGLQSVPLDPKLIQRLDADREAVLKAVRRETIYYMLLATEVT